MVQTPKQRRRVLLSAAAVLALVLFLVFPARYAESVRTGVSLWAASVLPATLPFLFLVSLFAELPLFDRVTRALAPAAGKVFRVSGAGGCAAILSLLSGYPVGARTLASFAESGLISEEETFRAAALATTSGPGFLVGAVGCGMFLDPAVGWVLYGAHVAGVWGAALLLRGKGPLPVRRELPKKTPKPLSDLLAGSVLAVLTVGGTIALFNAFGQMLADAGAFLSLPPAAEATVRGLLEMTAGCALLAQTPSPLSVALCAFLVTFGGLCVLVQELAFLAPCGVNAGKLVAVKALQGLLAAAVAYPLALLL